MRSFAARSVVISIFALLIIVSCSSTGARQQRSTSTRSEIIAPGAPDQMVTVGMSQSQVRRLWGEPRDIIAAEDQSGQEIWTYEFKKAVSRSVSRTVYTLTFAEGKLTEVAEKMF